MISQRKLTSGSTMIEISNGYEKSQTCVVRNECLT